MLRIVGKRATRAQSALAAEGFVLIDVTSSSSSSVYRRFSPFYPHGGVPVPGLPDATSASVEGVWQGLKVFEREGVDPGKFKVTSMRGLKRAAGVRRGSVCGHLLGGDVIGYLEARTRIYIPTYQYVLETFLQAEVACLRRMLEEGVRVALVDFDTNEDVSDLSRPLAHSSLVKQAVLAGVGVGASAAPSVR